MKLRFFEIGILLQIGIVAVLMSRNIGPLPVVAGLVGFGLIFFLLIKWLRRESRLEEEVIERLSDPTLRTVLCRRDSWEAMIDLGGSIGCVSVTGFTYRPTDQQRLTASQLPKRISALLEASAEAARDVVGERVRGISASDLVIDSIFLDESMSGTFGMIFDLPRFKAELPWGLSVDFADYQVEAAEQVH